MVPTLPTTTLRTTRNHLALKRTSLPRRLPHPKELDRALNHLFASPCQVVTCDQLFKDKFDRSAALAIIKVKVRLLAVRHQLQHEVRTCNLK